MAVRIITNREDNYQVMYWSTTMTAFGPVHSETDFDLYDFIQWLRPIDPRTFSQHALDVRYCEWIEESRLALEKETAEYQAQYPPIIEE